MGSRRGGHEFGVGREHKGEASSTARPAGVTLMSGGRAATRVCPGDSMVCVGVEECPRCLGSTRGQTFWVRSQFCCFPAS